MADSVRIPSRQVPASGLIDPAQLLDLAYDAIFVRTFDDRRIIYWNRGAEETYGYSPEQALGRIPGELLQTRYPLPLADIETAIARDGRWEGVLVQQRRDGGEVVVNGRWALQRDDDGGPVAILEINSDITERSQAEHRERAIEERFRLLVEAVQDYAIFMLDADGYIASWNAGAARIKGYTAGEAIGKHFSIFYPPEDIASDKPGRELKTAVAEGRLEDEGWRLRKDGSRFWANVVITALFDAGGTLRGFGKVTRDLTERKRSEQAAAEFQAREAAQLRLQVEHSAELEKAKSRLLNLASHELRGPLAVLRGYISMIADGTITGDKIAAVAPILAAKATQMNALVQQMLESARLEDSRMQLNRRSVDLAELTARVVAEWQPLVPRGQRMIATTNGSVLAEVDEVRVHTIVSNLIDNAIKYSGSRGVIGVTVSSVDRSAIITLRDEGPGIAPEDLPKLFGRFERIVTEENQHVPGTGLGLYLARELARLHAGDLTATSVPGKGAEFVLRLPLRRSR